MVRVGLGDKKKNCILIEYYDSMKTEKLEFSGFSAKRFLLKDLKINRMLLIKVSDLPLYVGFNFFKLTQTFPACRMSRPFHKWM